MVSDFDSFLSSGKLKLSSYWPSLSYSLSRAVENKLIWKWQILLQLFVATENEKNKHLKKASDMAATRNILIMFVLYKYETTF